MAWRKKKKDPQKNEVRLKERKWDFNVGVSCEEMR